MLWEAISTLERMFHQISKNFEVDWKKIRYASFFQPTSQCLDMWWNTLPCVWYNTSSASSSILKSESCSMWSSNDWNNCYESTHYSQKFRADKLSTFFKSSYHSRGVATRQKVFAPFLFIACDRQMITFFGFLYSCVPFFRFFMFRFSVMCCYSTPARWIWNDHKQLGTTLLVRYLSFHPRRIIANDCQQ